MKNNVQNVARYYWEESKEEKKEDCKEDGKEENKEKSVKKIFCRRPLNIDLTAIELDFSVMQIKDAPIEDMSKMQSAINLDLSFNNLIDFPDRLLMLTNLVKLDLSHNQLKALPEYIGRLRKLKSLDLYSNHLERLPMCFSHLKNLAWLDLGKNRLKELPKNFGQLKMLRHLDLKSNQIERLPTRSHELKNLTWLDLKNNPLIPLFQEDAGPCIQVSSKSIEFKKHEDRNKYDDKNPDEHDEACSENVISFLKAKKDSIVNTQKGIVNKGRIVCNKSQL